MSAFCRLLVLLFVCIGVLMCGIIRFIYDRNLWWLWLDRAAVVRVFGTLAFLLFLCSVLSPFLEVSWSGLRTFVGFPGPLTFWSFRMTNVYFRAPDDLVVNEYWFLDYWSKYTNYGTSELGFAMSTVLALLFAAQIFTILFGALVVSKSKSYLSVSAAVSNIVTIFCMWLVSRVFIYPYFRYVFLVGFWLAFASAILFFAVFILSWKWLRKDVARAELHTAL